MVLAAIAFVCFDMAILLLVLRSPYRNPLGAGARQVHPILRHPPPRFAVTQDTAAAR